MIDTVIPCKDHLLGEHFELHKHRHNFIKKHSMNGRLHPMPQIEPSSMESRHNELVEEMLRRGYNHNSPYEQPDISYLGDDANIKIDKKVALSLLINKCDKCRKRYYEFIGSKI